MSALSFLEKENVSLLINIGSGSINASLVSFQKKQVPKFLYSLNVPFVGEKQDNPNFSKEAEMLLDSTLKNTIKNGWNKIPSKNKKISHAIISFSSPLFVFKTKNIHLSQDIPFVITKSFLNSILVKEEKVFEKELIKENQTDINDKIDVIERSVVHTKINGYEVTDIVGKKTKSLEAFVCMSAISRNLKEKVEEGVLRHTHIPHENILMQSLPLTLFSTVRDNFTTDSDFLLINTNPETTDVILVNNHSVKSIATFPFGKNTIIRLIAKSFNISTEIAESQLIMYLSEKVNEQVSGTMQDLLQSLEKEWAIYFEDAMLTVSPNMIWPQKTFVVMEKNTSAIFIEFLKTHKIDSTITFRKNADVIPVDESSLSHLYEKDIKSQAGEPLILLAIFYNKLFQAQ